MGRVCNFPKKFEKKFFLFVETILEQKEFVPLTLFSLER